MRYSRPDCSAALGAGANPDSTTALINLTMGANDPGGWTIPVHQPWFEVRLATGARDTPTIRRSRYAHQPTVAFPPGSLDAGAVGPTLGVVTSASSAPDRALSRNTSRSRRQTHISLY